MVAESGQKQALTIPANLVIFSLILSWTVPILARLPGLFFQGSEWLTDYFSGGLTGLLLLTALNLIPGFVWILIGRFGKQYKLAFWSSVAVGVAILFYAHGSLDLDSSSTASIGLVIIPFFASATILAGWLLGWITHFLVSSELIRYQLAIGMGVLFIGYGIVAPTLEIHRISDREARFPITAVDDLPLELSVVVPQDSASGSGIDVIKTGMFLPVNRPTLAALTDDQIILYESETGSYESLRSIEFKKESCENCVHMNPQITTDSQGNILVSTSDGVLLSDGRFSWRREASGFSKVLPVEMDSGSPLFFTFQRLTHVMLHNTDGEELWQKDLRVSDIGVYKTRQDTELPFAISQGDSLQRVVVYKNSGEIERSIEIPAWVNSVQAISWPQSGHLLVGDAARFAVLNQQGEIVLEHTISNTSFPTYHGPDGIAVSFDGDNSPYLSVMAHGSSGYNRSVLLIFNLDGELVWQQEMEKLTSMETVTNLQTGAENLLVAGRPGIIELTLPGMINQP